MYMYMNYRGSLDRIRDSLTKLIQEESSIVGKENKPGSENIQVPAPRVVGMLLEK